MPSVYSADSDLPSSKHAYFINSSIWSDNVEQQRNLQNYLQTSQLQQPNTGTLAMQQLAYELALFNLNHHHHQPQTHANDNSNGGIDCPQNGSADNTSVSSLAATALIAAAAVLDEENENQSGVLVRKRSQNTTECVPVPSSEHVAEIVGRQGCKIKALRAKTNTYIKTPVRGDEPVFVVTGRRDDVDAAKREILSAADHFTQIRASRRHSQGGIPAPGHVTAYVRVPYKVVGLVVGPKGATIKRIQQQTHTYIITPSREKDPVFEVSGLPDNVEAARREIETHIANRTGVYPSTTIGQQQSRSCEDDIGGFGGGGGGGGGGNNIQNLATLFNEFRLNGADATLTNSASGSPDSTPTNPGSLFSLDTRRDSIGSYSAPLYFQSFTRAASFSASNPFPLPTVTACSEQRRASADTFF